MEVKELHLIVYYGFNKEGPFYSKIYAISPKKNYFNDSIYKRVKNAKKLIAKAHNKNENDIYIKGYHFVPYPYDGEINILYQPHPFYPNNKDRELYDIKDEKEKKYIYVRYKINSSLIKTIRDDIICLITDHSDIDGYLNDAKTLIIDIFNVDEEEVTIMEYKYFGTELHFIDC